MGKGTLLDTLGRLVSARGLGDVIEIVRTSVRNLIGAQGISFILRDGDTCHYIEEDAIGPLWKDKRFPLTSCISGWTMLNRETASISDITTDPRIPQELYRATFVRSLLMVPVGAEDPIGAIGIYWDHKHEADEDEVAVLEAIAGACTTALDHVRLTAELARACSEIELGRQELRHRLRNAYESAQALAAVSLPPGLARDLSGRLTGLSRAHELIDERLARGASVLVREILDLELAPYAMDDPGRLSLSGPNVTLRAVSASALALAVNELATNAVKFGAFSVESGRIAVSWMTHGTYLRILWIESNGPEVLTTSAESFGSRLLKRLIEGQLRGTVSRKFISSGVVCEIEFPLNNSSAGIFIPAQ